MIWYPQLQSGALSQFPGRRERRWRVIENRFESGERVAYNDVWGGQVVWSLDYRELSKIEVQALTDLFSAVKGSYGSFGFIDPYVNLIAGSEDLSRPDWQMGVMSASQGITDPLGTQRAWRITNASAGDQDLEQTLSFPGQVITCFSAYIRSDHSHSIAMRRDSVVTAQPVGTAWTRVLATGKGDPELETSTFGLRIGTGETFDLWGLQVEAQPYSSQYKVSNGAKGIFPRTNFSHDELTVTVTAPGRSSCSVQAISQIS